MSVFRVFAQSGSYTFDNQFAGTVIAGDCFHDYWTVGNGNKVFSDFIYGLIYDHHCTVTYLVDDHYHEVQGNDPGGGHNKQLFYVDAQGHRKNIVVQAGQDNPNNNVVSMAVPAVCTVAAYLVTQLI